jgi:hypothetical protein
VPIVGQPFTLTGIAVPVNATLTCNCGGADVAVTITMSTSMACPSCRKRYNAVFNPLQNKIEFQIAVPEAEKVPS